MICKSCGEPIPDGMSICQNCGTPLELEEKNIENAQQIESALPESLNLNNEALISGTVTPVDNTTVESLTIPETKEVGPSVSTFPMTEVLDTSPIENSPTNTEELSPVNNSLVENPIEQVQSQHSEEKRVEESKEKKSNGGNKIIMYLLFIIIGAAIGGVVVYYLFGPMANSSKQNESNECEEKVITVSNQVVKVNGFSFSLLDSYVYEVGTDSILFSDGKFIAEVVLTDQVYETLKNSKDFISPYFSSNGYAVSSSDVKTFSEIELISVVATKDEKNYIFGYVPGLNNKTYGVSITNIEGNISEEIWDTIVPILKNAKYSANDNTNTVTNPFVDNTLLKNIEL